MYPLAQGEGMTDPVSTFICVGPTWLVGKIQALSCNGLGMAAGFQDFRMPQSVSGFQDFRMP